MAKFIAVIDDDAAFLNLMQVLLEEEEGYRVLLLHREDGAIERLREAVPDAIVLDVRLEHPAGGWNLLEAVRLDRALAGIPVIVCSADEHEIQERAADLRRYHAEVLPKPFDLHDLLSMIRRLVGPAEAA